jgi:hypothetical protein
MWVVRLKADTTGMGFDRNVFSAISAISALIVVTRVTSVTNYN